MNVNEFGGWGISSIDMALIIILLMSAIAIFFAFYGLHIARYHGERIAAAVVVFCSSAIVYGLTFLSAPWVKEEMCAKLAHMVGLLPWQ